MSLCSDAPEDEAISLFPGLLPNPDVSLSHRLTCHLDPLYLHRVSFALGDLQHS
jgi:hypothetical protein